MKRGCPLILAGLVLFAATTSGAASNDELEALTKAYAQPGLPGCAIGTAENGALTRWAAFGLADVENGAPIGPETRFDIGSMSKQFLAMAVLMLAAEGKLSLDDEVHKYVPELPHYPWPVKLRNLLHHTSGLKDYDQLLQLGGWVDGDLKSAHAIQWVIERQKTLAFRPGSRYAYSDSNYFLLGLITQRIADEPLATVLQQRIFEPLGMTHTSLRTDRWALIEHKAWPYTVNEGKARLFVNAEEPLGDGGIFSTVGDLALWERNFDDAAVGGPQIVKEMEAVRPLDGGAPNEYASGLYLRSYRGHRMIEHSGASYGYLADKLRFPEQHASVIVLCNRRDGPYVELSNQAADLVLGLSSTDQPFVAQAVGPAMHLDRFAGLYFSDTAADGVLLEIKDGALVDAGAERAFWQTDPSSFVSSPAGTLCRCSTTYRFHNSPTGAVMGFDSIRPAG